MAAAPGKTWSTHRSAFAQGTHQFDILGYSAARAALGGDGGSVRSGSFGAGGFLWALVCRLHDRSQPCGLASISLELGGDGGSVRSGSFGAGGFLWALVCRLHDRSQPCGLASISLELSKNETAKDVVALASLWIGSRTGQFPPAVWRSDKAKTFAARSSSAVSWELAVPNAFLDHEERYVHEGADCLIIHCTVDVLLQQQHEGSADTTRSCLLLVPPLPPSISRDFHSLLRERRSPELDVTFVVEDGTEIQAHKLVLAMRSPVFAAQFLRGDMKERTTRRLKMDGMAASTLKAMRYFIYTDNLPVPRRGRCLVTQTRDLLMAADLYDLQRLRLMCENILSLSIHVDNVMATLMVVHGRHSCRQLEESCIEFIASGPSVYETVKATEEYKELEETYPSFINEVTKKVAGRAVALLRSSQSTSSSSGTSADGMSIEMTTRSMSFYTPSSVMIGTHEFTIQNLSVARKTHRVGQPIRSGSFQVGGYEWTIEVFPSGETKDMAEYIGIFVKPSIDDDDTMVKASVTLKLVEPTGESSPFSPQHFIDIYVGKACRGIGWANFITVASANSHYVGHDGSFTVQCYIEVIMESFTSKITNNIAKVIHVPPSNMAWHLEQLLMSEEGFDVKFLVEEIEIPAHGLVIAARSPELHEVMESATGTDHVRINGMRAASFRSMIHFIYTDELPRVDDLVPTDSKDSMTTVAGEMLAAACRFRLDRMKQLCINLLAENVTTVLSALATTKMARCHNCPELEQYCRWYMSLPHVTNNVMATCIDLFLESQLA